MTFLKTFLKYSRNNIFLNRFSNLKFNRRSKNHHLHRNSIDINRLQLNLFLFDCSKSKNNFVFSNEIQSEIFEIFLTFKASNDRHRFFSMIKSFYDDKKQLYSRTHQIESIVD